MLRALMDHLVHQSAEFPVIRIRIKPHALRECVLRELRDGFRMELCVKLGDDG